MRWIGFDRGALTEHDWEVNDEEGEIDKIEPTVPC